MKVCNARHSDIVVLGHRCEVRCQRFYGHPGMHRSVPMGKFVEWIEQDRFRGIARLQGDDLPVVSPSDRRHRVSWWQRLVAWLSGKLGRA